MALVKAFLRAVVQGLCLPAVPFMAAYAWLAEDGLGARQAVRFAWDWWLGFWEVLS